MSLLPVIRVQTEISASRPLNSDLVTDDTVATSEPFLQDDTPSTEDFPAS